MRSAKQRASAAAEPVSRRDLVVKSGIAAAAAVVGVVARPSVASATDGDYVQVGQLRWSSSDTPTVISNLSQSVLATICGAGRGLAGRGAPGVYAESYSGDAIEASANVAGKSAVYAHHDGSGGWGVWAKGPTGVHAESPTGHGVDARATADYMAAVYANHAGTLGYGLVANGQKGVYATGSSAGVEASGPVGVFGEGSSIGLKGESPTGTGVKAVGQGGVGLEVVGRALFTQAGRHYIPKGKSYRTVGGLKVGTGSAILVTLNGNPGAGIYVSRAVRATATSFTVYLTRAATATTYFSYFVIN